jgi:hypothetical protein
VPGRKPVKYLVILFGIIYWTPEGIAFVGIGRQAFIATLSLKNGNGGYQVSEIGAGLVKAPLVFAGRLADLIALAAQGGDCSNLGHCWL